jgi:predicted Zn-dependent protease
VTGQPTSDDLFYSGSDLTSDRAVALTEDALANADDGELFLEYRQSENLVFDDGQLRTASFDVHHGFGLRAISGEASAYAHSADISRSRHQACRRNGSCGAARFGRCRPALPAPTSAFTRQTTRSSK